MFMRLLYIEILDYFNANSLFAKVNSEVFCLSPFIHFYQEIHETNAIICFYKNEKIGKYLFEVVGKFQDKEFEKPTFDLMENQLRGLVV